MESELLDVQAGRSLYLSASQRLYFACRYYLFQVQSNPRMAKYLEEKLKWRLAKEKDKNGVAEQFIQEVSRGSDTRRNFSNFAGQRNVRFAPRRRGRTPYPTNAIPTERRGVYTVAGAESRNRQRSCGGRRKRRKPRGGKRLRQV